MAKHQGGNEEKINQMTHTRQRNHGNRLICMPFYALNALLACRILVICFRCAIHVAKEIVIEHRQASLRSVRIFAYRPAMYYDAR